jgi:prevent-host-death family protein
MAAARTAPLLLLRAWPWLNPDGLEIRCVAPSLLDKVVASGEMNVADVVANQVSVRDLKTHLSTWLARAQAGEVVEVTSHRKPIARITAVKSPEQGSADPLQAAIEAGVVSWNGQKPVFPPPIKLKGQGKLISEIVIEDRG